MAEKKAKQVGRPTATPPATYHSLESEWHYRLRCYFLA